MTATVEDWALALADTLLPADANAGRPVRLDADDSALDRAARRLGLPGPGAAALAASLRAGGLVDDRRGVAGAARARGGRPPLCLPALAALVVAASRMESDEQRSNAAYYRRLGDLLGVPLRDAWPQIAGTDELVRRFPDIAAWMADDEHGRRGLLDLPADVHPSVVGIPIRQSLLRAGDRRTLTAFFDRTARLIDIGWDPVHQLRRWGARHDLSVPLLELLDEPAMHQALASALRAARAAWDGSTIDAAGRRLLPAQLGLHLPPRPLTLSATVPALAAPAHATGPDGTQVALEAGVAAAVPLSWLAGAQDGPLVIDTGVERVRLLPGPAILFEIDELGVHSVAAAAHDPVFMLTCEPQLIAGCDARRRISTGLPAGWELLCDVDPLTLPDELRVPADDEPGAPGGIQLTGGLALGAGVWLLDHPPALSADLPEPAPVTVDGRDRGYLEPGQTLTLQDIAHDEGVHRIDIGGRELTVELAGRGPRDGIGDLAIGFDVRNAHAGAQPRSAIGRERACGPCIDPDPGEAAAAAVIVRYRAAVDVIGRDGSVRKLAPPTPASWLDHVGLPQDGPWEIPDAADVVWVCVDVPGRKFVVAHQAVDVELTDDVLDVGDWYADAVQVVDRSGGGAAERWQRIVAAAEVAA